MPSTCEFAVGEEVEIKDQNHNEKCVIASISVGVDTSTLTMVDNLTYSYTTAAAANLSGRRSDLQINRAAKDNTCLTMQIFLNQQRKQHPLCSTRVIKPAVACEGTTWGTD